MGIFSVRLFVAVPSLQGSSRLVMERVATFVKKRGTQEGQRPISALLGESEVLP